MPATRDWAGSARTPVSSTRTRLVALSGRVAASLDLPPTSRARSSAVPAPCASTPARPARCRCIRDRRHPLHLVSHHRASAAPFQRQQRRSVWCSPLWLRCLSGRLPLESCAAGDARSGVVSRAPAAPPPAAATCGSKATPSFTSSCRARAMTRTSMSRLRRNLAVALGNSGDPARGDCSTGRGRHPPRCAERARRRWSRNTSSGRRRS